MNRRLWIIGAIAAAVAVGLEMTLNKPKGIRNNNPGNLRAGVPWEGVTGHDDSGFAVFSSAFYGLRAAAKNLINYGAVHGVNTVSEIASRWAPSFENNTAEYASGILSYVNSESVDLSDPATVQSVLAGIVRNENGQKFPGIDWFSDQEIKTAVSAAFAQVA